MARERRHELLALFTVIMSSDEDGAEEFGPYDSATAAALAIERVTSGKQDIGVNARWFRKRSRLSACSMRRAAGA